MKAHTPEIDPLLRPTPAAASPLKWAAREELRKNRFRLDGSGR
jgi:hypothetical protein